MSSIKQFNPGEKSWKIYAKELLSINGDDLILKPHENNNLILDPSNANVISNTNIEISNNGIINATTNTINKPNSIIFTPPKLDMNVYDVGLNRDFDQSLNITTEHAVLYVSNPYADNPNQPQIIPGLAVSIMKLKANNLHISGFLPMSNPENPENPNEIFKPTIISFSQSESLFDNSFGFIAYDLSQNQFQLSSGRISKVDTSKPMAPTIGPTKLTVRDLDVENIRSDFNNSHELHFIDGNGNVNGIILASNSGDIHIHDISNKILIYGDMSISGDVLFKGPVTMDESLNVQGLTSINILHFIDENGNLNGIILANPTGDIHIYDISNKIVIDGDMSISGGVLFKGPVTMEESLNVQGLTSINNLYTNSLGVQKNSIGISDSSFSNINDSLHKTIIIGIDAGSDLSSNLYYDNNIYIGSNSQPISSDLSTSFEIVIGSDASGNGSNTNTIGVPNNRSITYLGYLKLGNLRENIDYVEFAHNQLSNTNSYALAQNRYGDTYINAASEKKIHFRIDNSSNNEITYDGTRLDLSGIILDVNTINASQLNFNGLSTNIPTESGRLYKDSNNFLKISP